MKKYISLFALLLVVGCASKITGKVISFNDNVAGIGKSYYVDATPEQQRDLAFKTYTGFMADALAKYNYTQTNDKTYADYIANINYGTKNPISDVSIDDEDAHTSVYYTSFFKLDFVDRKTMKPVYNTESSILTRQSNFLPYSRCVIDVAFIDFPNSNQSTRSREVVVDDCYIEQKDEEEKSFFFF